MANTPYLGNKIIAQLDRSTTGVADWALVGCLTDSDIDGSRETIDASSKCGPAQLAGQKTDTANFTGFMDADQSTPNVTLDELAAIYDAGESRHWRYLDDEGGSTYYREFNGPLTAFNESTNFNEAITFTGTVAITGDIIRTLPVS